MIAGESSWPIVSGDEEMRKLCRNIERLAAANVAVLLIGESGTGKERLARALHERGKRADGPFVTVNCAAGPEAVLDGELFGDAATDRQGALARADRGTLYLEDIGDLPPLPQLRLLRVLQETAPDVRLVCSSRTELDTRLGSGAFREDLFHRLSEVILRVPPLRRRFGDVALLADHFLEKLSARFNPGIAGFTPAAMAAIAAHDWPGNVRELESRVKRAVIMADGTMLDPVDLELAPSAPRPIDLDIRAARMRASREVVQRALRQSNGTISKAAKLLGVSRPTLYALIQSHGLAATAERAIDAEAGAALRLRGNGTTAAGEEGEWSSGS